MSPAILGAESKKDEGLRRAAGGRVPGPRGSACATPAHSRGARGRPVALGHEVLGGCPLNEVRRRRQGRGENDCDAVVKATVGGSHRGLNTRQGRGEKPLRSNHPR